MNSRNIYTSFINVFNIRSGYITPSKNTDYNKFVPFSWKNQWVWG